MLISLLAADRQAATGSLLAWSTIVRAIGLLQALGSCFCFVMDIEGSVDSNRPRLVDAVFIRLGWLLMR